MRRSKLEIALEILGVVSIGIEKPTKIMYSAKLSWNSVQKYLSKLVEQGLIREFQVESGDNLMSRYEITDKGEHVLHYFNKAEEIIELSEII